MEPSDQSLLPLAHPSLKDESIMSHHDRGAMDSVMAGTTSREASRGSRCWYGIASRGS